MRQRASTCRQSASVNRLAPTPLPQRPRSFSKTAANRSVQERILSNAGPLSVRAGRKILNPADFLPIMHRSGKRSDAAPSPQSSGIPARTRQAKRRRPRREAGGKQRHPRISKSFHAVPAGRPRPAGRQRGNSHTPTIAPQRTPTLRARPTGAGPLSVRAGRKILNPANFLPVMLRSGKRSDAAPSPQSNGMQARTQQAKRRRPAAKQAASKGIHAIQNFSTPSRRDGPRPVRTGGAAIRTRTAPKAAQAAKRRNPRDCESFRAPEARPPPVFA